MAKKKSSKLKQTEVFVVLDRSGSMMSVLEDTVGGFNSFLAQQRSEPGKCHLSLLQFDDEIDLVHDGVLLKDVPDLTKETYVPRSSTALLDAIGEGIGRLDQRVSGKKRQVIFIILTDGMENASREMDQGQIHALITARKKDGWVFQYLGANQDAIAVGGALGVDASHAATYAGTPETTRAAFGATSRSVGSFRRTGNPTAAAYLNVERSAMGGSGTLSASEAAEEIGVSPRTLQRMEENGRAPAPHRPSGNPRGKRVYRRQDLRDLTKGGAK